MISSINLFIGNELKNIINPFGPLFKDSSVFFDGSSIFNSSKIRNLDDFKSKYSKFLDKIKNLECEGNICLTCENKPNKCCTHCLNGSLYYEFINSCKNGQLLVD